MPISRDTLTRSLNSISVPIEEDLTGVGEGSGYETVDWTTYGTVFLNVESVSSAITLDSGDEVGTWDSRGDGNSRTLIKPTSGFSLVAPDFNSTGVINSSVGSVDFDASNLTSLAYGQTQADWDFMGTGANATIFIVINATFAASANMVIIGDHNSNTPTGGFGFRISKDANNSRIRAYCNDFPGILRYDVTSGANTFESGTSYIVALRVEEGATNEVELFIDGVSAATSALNDSSPNGLSSNFAMGADPDRDGEYLTGSIGQCLVYTTALSSANMTEVFSKLSSNWGITLSS